MLTLLAVAPAGAGDIFLQQLINGLTTGTLFALIAIGYTMVYGIIELINFAHGDLFMLGAFLALWLVSHLGLLNAGPAGAAAGLVLTFLITIGICAGLNLLQDRIVYRPLRNAPKLTPLVSAIGVSFVFIGIRQILNGVADINFPDILPNRNLLGTESLRFTAKYLLVILITVPLMAGLTVFVRFTKLGKAMR